LPRFGKFEQQKKNSAPPLGELQPRAPMSASEKEHENELVHMNKRLASTPRKRTPRSFVTKWLQVFAAFGAFYAFLACLTVALFSIAMAILFPEGDPRQPCPFPALVHTNCNSLCAGPPQLMRAWQAAAEGSAERAAAAQTIEAWIAGTHSFAWDSNDNATDGVSEFDGLQVTNQFFRKLQCCKLLDGVALTEENIANDTMWDDGFNSNADDRDITCNNWIEKEKL
jgi:hypothetical protein